MVGLAGRCVAGDGFIGALLCGLVGGVVARLGGRAVLFAVVAADGMGERGAVCAGRGFPERRELLRARAAVGEGG